MEVASLTLPLFSLILLGYIAGRTRPIGESGLQWMNFYIIYIALPALFFQLIRKTPVDQLGNISFIVGTTSATFVVFWIAWLLGKLFLRRNSKEATIMGVAGAYANVGYMGPALTLAAFGEAAVVPTALVFCFDNALLFTLAPMLFAFADHRPGFTVFLSVLKKVLMHPFILSTIFAIAAALIELRLPKGVNTVLDLLKNSAAPCALFTMGVVIANRKVALNLPEIPLLTFIKLVIHPLMVLLALSLMGDIDLLWVSTAVLMASLPAALNVFIFAQQYDTMVREASTVVLTTTVLAVFTVTGVLFLLQQ